MKYYCYEYERVIKEIDSDGAAGNAKQQMDAGSVQNYNPNTGYVGAVDLSYVIGTLETSVAQYGPYGLGVAAIVLAGAGLGYLIGQSDSSAKSIVDGTIAGGMGDLLREANKDTQKPKSGTGKEKSSDIPSWARGEAPYVGESGNDFAGRLLNEKYGQNNWKKGPGTEHNKLKKWGDRGFK